MAELNRELFDRRIGEILTGLGLATPEAQARMLEIQARGIVLAAKEMKPMATIAELDNDEAFSQLQTKYAINEAEISDARKRAAEPRSIPVPGIPPAAAVLSALPGGVDSVVKDALLAAQASEKALRAIDRAKLTGQAYDDASYAEFQAKNAELLDGVPQNEFVHLGRAGESAIVRSAQQAYKSAREFEALEHHVDCAEASKDPAFAARRALLATTLPQIAAATYRTAAMALGIRAEAMAKADHPDATKIADIADRLITLLANEKTLNIQPPTRAEIDRFAADHPELSAEVQGAARQAGALGDATKKWVDTIGRGGAGQGMSATI